MLARVELPLGDGMAQGRVTKAHEIMTVTHLEGPTITLSKTAENTLLNLRMARKLTLPQMSLRKACMLNVTLKGICMLCLTQLLTFAKVLLLIVMQTIE